jgi:hypothetical protein
MTESLILSIIGYSRYFLTLTRTIHMLNRPFSTLPVLQFSVEIQVVYFKNFQNNMVIR